MSGSREAGDAHSPISPSSTSPSLLERVKNQDRAAWERLVDVYAPLVYRWCRRTGVRADDAPDIVQEVFLAVAIHVADFHSDKPGDSFRGWLWTITRNKIYDDVRRRKGSVLACGGSSAAERMCRIPKRLPSVPDGETDRTEDAILAQRVLELIRPEVADRTWQAFWRVAIDGQTGRGVADELGKEPPGRPPVEVPRPAARSSGNERPAPVTVSLHFFRLTTEPV